MSNNSLVSYQHLLEYEDELSKEYSKKDVRKILNKAAKLIKAWKKKREGFNQNLPHTKLFIYQAIQELGLDIP